jgi:hypothetical protein
MVPLRVPAGYMATARVAMLALTILLDRKEYDRRSLFLSGVIHCFYVQKRNSRWFTGEETP